MKTYRTACTLLLFGMMVLGALWICAHYGPVSEPMFAPAATALSTLGLYAAGKSAFQHHVENRAAAAAPEAKP